MTEHSAMVVPNPGTPIVGIVGGGQLARMSSQAATALGVGLRLLSAGPNDSAALVMREVVLGDPDDPDAAAAFANTCDVVTLDHEQVPPPTLAAMTATGTHVRPGASALRCAQDKLVMRRELSAAGLPCPAWTEGATPAEVSAFAEEHGWPVVVKASRGGYDGKGVWFCRNVDDVVAAFATPLPPGARRLVEAAIEFKQELAAVVARSPSGQAVAYPVVQTVQENGICTRVVAPAPNLADALAMKAQQVALRVAEQLDVVGLLAVELFEVDDEVLINELAMRPHNSGHWSIDGAVTSQFENHLRAVLDLPLGDPSTRADWTVMVNILGGPNEDLYASLPHIMAKDPRIKVHLYGKAVRPGRKLGHVTSYGDDLQDCLSCANYAADYLTGGRPGTLPKTGVSDGK